ncbi:MAG: SRPBCC family protein [Gammaproteobacteria bacterium]|nr:SRPBCC family protein [Gammaproteobacteria bacterium]
MMSDKPEYIYEIFIRTTPEKLWEALTSAAFTRLYFHNTEINSDWKVGSPVVFNRANDGGIAVEGEILAADKPRLLSYTWRALYDEDMAAESHSRLTFEIEEMPGVCRLRIVHDDFDADSKTYEQVSQGWSAIICSLKSLLETGEPLLLAGNEEAPEQEKGVA